MISRRDKGKQLYKDGDYNNAIEALLALNVVYEDDPETAYFLGLSYTQLGDFEQAESFFDIVLRYDIHVLRVFQSSMVLSYIYSITEKYDQAIRLILQVIDEGFESAQIYSTLAFCCYSSGNLEKSLDYLEKAIEQFDVSCPELDWLVKRAQETQGVYGSRLTGKGYGGCTVTLIENDKIETYEEHLEEYERIFGFKAEDFICKPSMGVKTIFPEEG